MAIDFLNQELPTMVHTPCERMLHSRMMHGRQSTPRCEAILSSDFRRAHPEDSKLRRAQAVLAAALTPKRVSRPR